MLMVGLMLGITATVSALEQVERSAAGMTLVAPHAVVEAGELYHITPGIDAQIVVRSDAPLQRVVGVCRHAVGYVAAPFDAEEGEPILALQLRVPLRSLLQGSGDLERPLAQPNMLNLAAGPDATFVLRELRDVTPFSIEQVGQGWTCTLVGSLTFRETSRELIIPAARFIRRPYTWKTMARFPGELMTLACSFDLKLSDYQVAIPPPLSERLADELRVDVFLLGNSVSPEKSLDPSVPSEDLAQIQRVVTLARDLGKEPEAHKLAYELLERYRDRPTVLHQLAVELLTAPDLSPRPTQFALRAAQAAVKQKPDDANMLDTLALAHYHVGEFAQAVAAQQRAVAGLEKAPPPVKAAAADALARYQALLSAVPATAVDRTETSVNR